MSTEQPTVEERFEEDHDDWLEEPEELPRRPRRRLLTPLPLALLGVLLVACGFIAGVLVEKGQSSSTSATGASAGVASRIAALRGASGAGSGAGAAGTSGAGRSGAGGFAGAFAGAGGGATAGQVAFISGSTLYVTTAEGNTVKVTTSPGSTVTKTVKASVSGIHPGETVIVTGSNTNGTISAESIRVGSSGRPRAACSEEARAAAAAPGPRAAARPAANRPCSAEASGACRREHRLSLRTGDSCQAGVRPSASHSKGASCLTSAQDVGPRLPAALVLLLASLGLAACGGSSGSTTRKASSSASASTTTPGGSTTPGSSTHPGLTPQGAARIKALRECLQKNGITLPQRTPRPASRRARRLSRRWSRPAAAQGRDARAVRSGDQEVRRQRFRQPRRSATGASGAPRPSRRSAKFADCMRKNGVNVPEPNTSGNGPIFDTKGIDTASTQFKSAETKCAAELRGAFRPGAAGAPAPARELRARAERSRLPLARGRPDGLRPRGRAQAPRAPESGIAAELGLVATPGAGRAPAREISCSHCVALSSPTTVAGTGVAAPARAVWAALLGVPGGGAFGGHARRPPRCSCRDLPARPCSGLPDSASG